MWWILEMQVNCLPSPQGSFRGLWWYWLFEGVFLKQCQRQQLTFIVWLHLSELPDVVQLLVEQGAGGGASVAAEDRGRGRRGGVTWHPLLGAVRWRQHHGGRPGVRGEVSHLRGTVTRLSATVALAGGGTLTGLLAVLPRCVTTNRNETHTVADSGFGQGANLPKRTPGPGGPPKLWWAHSRFEG